MALASSRRANASGDSAQPTLPRFCSSCSGVRAPKIGAVTPGWHSTQLSAIWAGVLSSSSLSAHSVSMICQVRSVSRCSGRSSQRSARPTRLSAGGAASRRYLPVSQPPPSGDQAMTPMPCSRHSGSSSHSVLRTSRLYSGWRQSKRAQPRISLSMIARMSCDGV